MLLVKLSRSHPFIGFVSVGIVYLYGAGTYSLCALSVPAFQSQSLKTHSIQGFIAKRGLQAYFPASLERELIV